MFFWTKLCSRRLQLFAQNIKNNHHSSEKLQQREVTRNQMATSIEDLYDTQCKLIELDMCPWVGGPWWLLFVQKNNKKLPNCQFDYILIWADPNDGLQQKNDWNMFWFHKKNRSQNLWSQTGPMHFLRCLMWQYRSILTISPSNCCPTKKHSDNPPCIYILYTYKYLDIAYTYNIILASYSQIY